MVKTDTIVLKLTDKHFLNISTEDDYYDFMTNRSDSDVVNFRENLSKRDTYLFTIIVCKNKLLNRDKYLDFDAFFNEHFENRNRWKQEVIDDFFYLCEAYYKGICSKLNSISLDKDDQLDDLRVYTIEGAKKIWEHLDSVYKEIREEDEVDVRIAKFSSFFGRFFRCLNVVKASTFIDITTNDLYEIV